MRIPDSGTPAPTVTLRRLRVAAVLLLGVFALTACEGLGQQGPGDDFDPIEAAGAPQGSLEEAREALRLRHYDRAYETFRKYVVVRPDDDAPKLGLAEAYIGRGESRNALTVLGTLSEEGRSKPTAAVLRGLALLLQGRLQGAREQLSAAVDQDETLWQAWNGLGLIHDAERNWEQAELSYLKAIEAEEAAAIARNNLGYSFLLQGRVDEAIEAFGDALSYDNELEVARENLRLALAAKGRYVNAVAGTHRRHLPRVLNNIGYVAMLRGDYVAAEAYFHRAIAESPSYYDAAVANLERLEVLQRLNERPGSPPGAGE